MMDMKAPETDARSGPVDRYLTALHRRISGISDGAIATYIPELAKVDPDLFGIAIATVDGRVYTAGHASVPFTIQSISKAFVYGYTLAEYGRDYVLSRIGVEPTGEAFNSIRLAPDNPKAHYQLALALRQAGATADANTHFAEAQRLAPYLRPPATPRDKSGRK